MTPGDLVAGEGEAPKLVRFVATVEVMPLESVADPEGETIERALPALGFTGIERVRVGKLIRFEIHAESEPEARSRGEELCDRLLANPVIEKARLRVATPAHTSDG